MHQDRLLPSNIGLFSNICMIFCPQGADAYVYCPLISGCSLTWQQWTRFRMNLRLLPSSIGLFSTPVSAMAHIQRAHRPFCGAKSFLSILPLFLHVVNLNGPRQSPYLSAFGAKGACLSNLSQYSSNPSVFTCTVLPQGASFGLS